VRISLLDPPRAVTVISLDGILIQTFEVQYKDGRVARPEGDGEEIVLGEINQSFPGSNAAGVCLCQRSPDGYLPTTTPLVKLAAGEEYQHSRHCRLPCDDFLRPTTLPDTDTPMRVSHRIKLEVRYRIEGEKDEMILAMGKPVTLSSWYISLISAFLLPD
jgi:hypothetical protein